MKYNAMAFKGDKSSVSADGIAFLARIKRLPFKWTEWCTYKSHYGLQIATLFYMMYNV